MPALRPARPRAPQRLAAAFLAFGLVTAGGAALAPAATAKAKPPAKDGAAKGDRPSGPPASPLPPSDALKVLAATLDQAPEAPPSPDDGFVAVVVADHDVTARALQLADAQAASDQAAQVLVGATDDRDGAARQVAAATTVRDRADATVKVERKRLSDLTVRAYVRGGDDSLQRLQAVAHGDTSDAAGGRQVVFAQVLARQRDVTTAAVASLDAAETKVASARRAQDSAQRVLDRAARAAADLTSNRAKAEAAQRTAVDAAAKARRSLQVAAGSALPQAPLEVPLIGVARLQPEDLAGWFETSPYVSALPTPITDLARWFIEEGNAEGIRGDVAFAQAILETGGFTNQDSVTANNYAGIGHCDSCGSGFTFPGPQAGVRAQIQLLKSYAVARPQYVNPLVDPRLHGPPGCCATWGALTKKWATDPGYGPKVMSLYTSMVEYALQRRAAGQGLEPSP